MDAVWRKRSGSTSPEVGDSVRRVDEVLERRRVDRGITFKSVRDAVGWAIETAQRMQSAHSMHPRGEKTASGEEVIVRVDGGKGGSLDEVLATVSSVQKLLKDLATERGYELAYHAVVAWAVGRSYREIGEQLGCSAATASGHVGKGEAYLRRGMREGGLLR